MKDGDAPRRLDPSSAALFGIVFSILCFAGAIATAIQQPARPNGDTVDEPGYWFATMLLFGSIGIIVLVLSVRALKRTYDDE